MSGPASTTGPAPPAGLDLHHRAAARAYLAGRDRLRPAELLFWLPVFAVPLVAPEHSALGANILVMMLFALSLDFILGYAGILTLGHAAYFGVGAYTAGLLSAKLGWHEPLTALAAAGVLGALFGALTGAVLLRYQGLTLLMLTLAVATMLFELANTFSDFTGGFDGLTGMAVKPLLGLFAWDLYGITGYYYAFVLLLVCYAALRRITAAPFGLTLVGMRENPLRLRAIGSPLLKHAVVAYAISCGIAGLAGALFAQSGGFITMEVLSFERSAVVLTMLILGGTGRLYGAFAGALVYMIAVDRLAKLNPVYWEFGVGLLLVIVVLACPDGLLGLYKRVRHALARRAA